MRGDVKKYVEVLGGAYNEGGGGSRARSKLFVRKIPLTLYTNAQ